MNRMNRQAFQEWIQETGLVPFEDNQMVNAKQGTTWCEKYNV